MVSHPLLFSRMMRKSSRNGCVPIVTGSIIRILNGLISSWFVVSNWKVGGHSIDCPNFFQASSSRTFTLEPSSTIVSKRTVPNIPISTAVRCRLDVRASSIGSIVLAPLSFFLMSIVLAPLSFSLICSPSSLVAGVMFVSVDQT